MEKTILDMESSEQVQNKFKNENCINTPKIKWLAMQLSRNNPSEWNLFLDVLLIS